MGKSATFASGAHSHSAVKPQRLRRNHHENCFHMAVVFRVVVADVAAHARSPALSTSWSSSRKTALRTIFFKVCAPLPMEPVLYLRLSPRLTTFKLRIGRPRAGQFSPRPVALANTYDLSHAHKAFNSMCDVVAGNPPSAGWTVLPALVADPKKGTTCPSNPQFKFVDNSTGIVNPYLTLATQYGWANYMFQTNQGPSFPAHQFIFGGTSAPSQLDDANGIFAAENMMGAGGAAGCNALSTTASNWFPRIPLPPPYGVENSTIFPVLNIRPWPTS